MKPDTPRLLPENFGPLQGVRIISSGTIIAQPFAAEMAAEMGAEVIQIERPGVGDVVWRNLEFPIKTPDDTSVSSAWVQERRNMFHVSLDLSTSKGKELFLRLIPQTDIWMESSKPGAYARWGLDDETVIKANPKIVITHVSGYGQAGHPDYLGRASYDFIGQAFGGMMHLTGFPDPDPPVRAVPWTADYITAGFCLWSSLAGYIYAQKTGKGQVIDLAQYEAIHKTMAGTMVAYYEHGLVRGRSGNKAGLFQPYDVFQAKDGWVIIAAVGTPFDRVCKVLGLDPKDAKWRKAHTDVESPEGLEFDGILRGWVEQREIGEVVEIMNAAQVGCTPIMTAKDMAEDPHYERRNTHIEWEDVQLGRKVKGIGICPAFSITPGKVWRGSVPLGHDNELIFTRLLGLKPTEVARLREEGVT
ncbi:MAG: CoA transferase [Chloroflexi bacterium]|nr:CoA transferase [Chloroflexota bacterium]